VQSPSNSSTATPIMLPDRACGQPRKNAVDRLSFTSFGVRFGSNRPSSGCLIRPAHRDHVLR
jgi:hypothetical protein